MQLANAAVSDAAEPESRVQYIVGQWDVVGV
jgi:hypothetical protein